VQITNADRAIGESGVADRVLAREFPNEGARFADPRVR
jgi:hypothetical protein